jgi:alpha-L-fucosidase
VSRGADKDGPMAGVPYDGNMTKADGKGKWWEGYDPQDLYAQNRKPGEKPDNAYCEKFYLRVQDLIDSYRPDLLYFDDGVMPLNGVSDAGLRIASHLYNSSIAANGTNQAVMNTKGLKDIQRKALVWDIERGFSNRIEPFPWQTDTCIGGWHYSRPLAERHGYKSPAYVVRLLVDIVSKNGNLLLSIPVRSDGTIDDDEVQCLEGIAKWMSVNSQAIYDTRPWKVYGEGSSTADNANHERQARTYTAEDFRFTAKGPTIYAMCMDLPKGQVKIKSLGKNSPETAKVADVTLLGDSGKIKWEQTDDALVIDCPDTLPSEYVIVFRIKTK